MIKTGMKSILMMLTITTMSIVDNSSKCIQVMIRLVHMQPPAAEARRFSGGRSCGVAIACSIMPTPERAEGERETPRASAGGLSAANARLFGQAFVQCTKGCRGWCRHYFYAPLTTKHPPPTTCDVPLTTHHVPSPTYKPALHNIYKK